LKYFYGFSIEEIKKLTWVQYFSFLKQIDCIRELFMGIGKEKDNLENQEMLKMAQGLGIKIPSKY